MKVKVIFFASLRKITGRKEMEIDLPEGATVADLLESLSNHFGEQFRKNIYVEKTGKPSGYYQFLVNGKNIHSLDGFNTQLNGGETFSMLLPVVGG